jgi:hypothetical protein
VRIRPQIAPDEPMAGRIEDPWRIIDCPAGSSGCRVGFDDPEFAALGRDTVYYVRAIQDASPTVNGNNLRCERDADGRCIKIAPCHASSATAPDDDCLAQVEERAWSSPIFVGHGTRE